MRVGDVLLLLYGVAERQAGRIDTELEAPFDLARTGHVKARPDIGQPFQHLWRRIGLHREKDPRGGQNLDQPQVASLDQIQVDDKKRRGQTRVIPQKPTDRLRGPGCRPTDREHLLRSYDPGPFHMHHANPNATQHCGLAESLSTLSGPGSDGLGRTEAWATVHAEKTWRRPPEIRLRDTFRRPDETPGWAWHRRLGDSFSVAIGRLSHGRPGLPVGAG